MNFKESSSENSELIKLLQSRLEQNKTCTELIDDYAEMMSSIWTFVARLLGNVGARAAIARAIQVASRNAPWIGMVKADVEGLDLHELSDYVIGQGCTQAEVMESLMRLAAAIFDVLADLSGDAITGPLLRHLEQKMELEGGNNTPSGER